MAKYYIFFTENIHHIGGQQLYTLGKVKYLEEHGWGVIVINPSHTTGKCGFPELDKFLKYGMVSLYYIPAELPSLVRRTVVNRLVNHCKFGKDASEIYVESQYLKGSLWAELFAKQVNAKHIIFDCGEKFRGEQYFYEDVIDFYKFKYKRKELYGISKTSVNQMFEGYDMGIPDHHEFYFNAVEPTPVKDIRIEKVEQLERLDYHILFISRGEKGYVPNVISGVAQFAEKHPDKAISFVLIGGMGSRERELNAVKNIPNLKLNVLGEMTPIPRQVFRYADVVIAGAGCAELSVSEGVKTIIADAKSYQAIGVFGYDTTEYFFAANPESNHGFDYYLEKLLINREYDNRVSDFPEGFNLEKEYQSQIRCFEKTDERLEYYDVMTCRIKRKVNKRKQIRCILSDIKSYFRNRR